MTSFEILDFLILIAPRRGGYGVLVRPKFDRDLNSAPGKFFLDLQSQFNDVFHADRRSVGGGASALTLLGVISRETVDCDVLTPTIPEEILKAASDFAKAQGPSLFLADGWLNNGPSSPLKNLPKDWNTRTQKIYAGKSLTLFSLGRSDLLKTKLFAYCDRARDLEDCIALNPTKAELIDAIEWVKYQDANPNWPKHVREMFDSLRKSLGHEL